jgi:hypothetical protein
MSVMGKPDITPAPRWRRVLAGIADAAIVGGPAWLWRRRAASAAGAGRARWLPLLVRLGEPIREQLGSPGQRLLGVRTVDRRTGRRVELWRTLVLLGAGVGGQLLERRLTPPVQTPEREREHKRYWAELDAISERHPAGSPERQAAQRALFADHPGPLVLNPWRSIGPFVAIGLLNNLLRRRLAWTTEVLARPRRAHSP